MTGTCTILFNWHTVLDLKNIVSAQHRTTFQEQSLSKNPVYQDQETKKDSVAGAIRGRDEGRQRRYG